MFYTIAGTNLSRGKFDAEPIFITGGFVRSVKNISEYLLGLSIYFTSYPFKNFLKNYSQEAWLFMSKSKSGNF